MNKVQELSGKSLDYWMYKYATHLIGEPSNDESFEAGYSEKRFHFSQDPMLLSDLLVQHNIRLQMLGGEWLASTEQTSAFGETPILAACRLVVMNLFGADLSKSL